MQCALEIHEEQRALCEHSDNPAIIAGSWNESLSTDAWAEFCEVEGMRRAFVAKENFDFSHREIGRAEVDEFEQRISQVVFAFESESNEANTIGQTGSLYVPHNISLKEKSFLRADHPSDHLAQGWRFTIEKPK